MKKSKMKIAALLLLTVTIVFTACKKDKDNGPSEKMLSFHLHTLAGNSAGNGSAEVNYTGTFTDNTGRKFKLSDCRYYISNIVLIKNDGTELPITGKVILANANNNDYEIGTVPVGSYKGFRFMMGLDSATNHSDPTTYPSTNPLSLQTQPIHWSWNSGYIFMMVEGLVDTSLAANGTPNFDFFYHVGLDNMKRTIDLSTSAFTVSGNGENEIGLLFDLRKVLNNVDMRTENETHSMDNMPLATKIANNWQSAFSLE